MAEAAITSDYGRESRLCTTTVRFWRKRDDVTIIIPQFGGSELTLDCVRSLRRHERERHAIVVVDDGSSPEHRARIAEAELPGVRLIAQPHAGITPAWDHGLAAAGTPFVVFLNNDTLARGPFVNRLLEPLRSSRTLLSGLRLRRETAVPADVLARLPSERFLEGWCLAVRTDDLQRIGGFDERMKLYFSDTDMQARLLLERRRGLDALVVVGDLPLDHAGHRTAHLQRGRRQQWNADRSAFVRKWRSGASA